MYSFIYTDSEGERNVSLMTKASKTMFCYQRRNNLTDLLTLLVSYLFTFPGCVIMPVI